MQRTPKKKVQRSEECQKKYGIEGGKCGEYSNSTSYLFFKLVSLCVQNDSIIGV